MCTSIVYSDLLTVFRSAQGKEVSTLSEAVVGCNIPEQLKVGICAAIGGDNRPLNNWLFSEGSISEQPIAWIAPIRSDVPRYVWMVGRQNKTSIQVHAWLNDAESKLANDQFLRQVEITPDLLFVDVVEVSTVTIGEFRHEDEFSVFQVGYKDAPVEVKDIDQKMIINTSLALCKRQEALTRMNSLVWLGTDTVVDFERDLEIFSIIHNEGHNRGHFVGAWPFEEVIKKKCLVYEAVEEFRACLASIMMAEHLPLSDAQKETYALSVFMSRFFGFGFDAFCLDEQRRETAREITVGMMFFQWLIKKEVIELNNSGSVSIRVQEVRTALIEAYELIFYQETRLSRNNQDDLKKVARFWYKHAFPKGTYSQEAKIVYSSLREASINTA